jgi:hypothetical protein
MSTVIGRRAGLTNVQEIVRIVHCGPHAMHMHCDVGGWMGSSEFIELPRAYSRGKKKRVSGEKHA